MAPYRSRYDDFAAPRQGECVFNVRELNNVVKGVESGEADIGFGLGLAAHSNLQFERLFEGRMVCVCLRGTPLSRASVVTPADLRLSEFVALDAKTRMGTAVREAFIAARQPFDFAITVHYCDTACDLVQAGLAPRLSTRSRRCAVGGSNWRC